MTVLPLLTPSGYASDTQKAVWPEAQAFFKLGPRVRLHALADIIYSPAPWTASETASDATAEVGVHFDVTLKPIARPKLRTRNWERERYLWVRFGYDYLWTFAGAGEPSHENRGIVELTARAPLRGGLALVNRARVDLRTKEGTDFARYRERLTMERETRLFGVETIPYASAELLYDTRNDAWSEQRYQTGLEIVLHERWRLEPYYQRKEDQRSEPKHTNTLGLVVKHYR